VRTKPILVMSAAAFALAVGGAALAEQPATPFVSGDEPMNVDDSGQVKAPDSSAKAQEKTEKMLQKEGRELSGDLSPTDEGDAAQLAAPKPNPAEQQATETELKTADEEAGAVSGKYQ